MSYNHEDTMIYGINPFHVREIDYQYFRRESGHPYFNRLVEKKYGRWSWLAWIVLSFKSERNYSPLPFSGLWRAKVHIYGKDPYRPIKTITCKSNAQAQQLYQELNEKLNSFLGEMSVLSKLHEGMST